LDPVKGNRGALWRSHFTLPPYFALSAAFTHTAKAKKKAGF
jgi:hypothetical protein